MFNNLKENILEEFNKVEEVLHSCKLAVNSSIPNPLIINTEDVFLKDKKDIEGLLKSITKHFTNDVIYKIELLEVDNKKEIIESFEKAKDNKVENRAFSKFNTENKETIINGKSNSITLYIGSSNKKRIYTRMRCHFGFGAKRTYAIHLKSWLPKKVKHKISITFLELSYQQNGVLKTNILELVEQALWYKEKPLLGKKSGLL